MKVVINTCYGGFSVSPKAALWMYEHGYTALATPIEKYWGDLDESGPLSYRDAVERWRNHKGGGDGGLFLTVFTADEKAVLSNRPDDRSHPLLVACIEQLGEEANGSCADLKIVEIPDDVEYEIDEYDGIEHIAEKHRTWR